MKWLPLFIIPALFLSRCEKDAAALKKPETLADARKGFRTRLIRKIRIGAKVPNPPPGLFQTVSYDSPVGQLAAYVSPSPQDGKKHPLIIWLVGGFDNSIGEFAWTPAPRENDQSASAFRKAGVLMMYPSLRGGNQNPGFFEGFYGEVDDVLAAARYAAKLDYVDPERIYLGGHSTGGTLALLTAECSDPFRAVFSFGPVEDVTGYGAENVPFDISNLQETLLRAPGEWLTGIRVPTFVFEGRGGNIGSLEAMAKTRHAGMVSFHPIDGGNHFNILAPISALVAEKIKEDRAAKPSISFSKQEVAVAMRK